METWYRREDLRIAIAYKDGWMDGWMDGESKESTYDSEWFLVKKKGNFLLQMLVGVDLLMADTICLSQFTRNIGGA